MRACKTPTARKGTSLLHVISFPSSLLPFPPSVSPLSPSPFIGLSFVSELSPSVPYLSISLVPHSPFFFPLPLAKTVGRLTLITVRFFPPQSDTHTLTHTHRRSALPACQAGPRDGCTLRGEQDTGKCSNNKTLTHTGSSLQVFLNTKSFKALL